MMLKDLLTWPEKLHEGARLANDFWQTYQPRAPKHIKKLAFVGMGGSGIAGRIIKTLLDKKSAVPAFIIDSPELPAHLEADTLAVVISYSGGTWETLDAFDALTGRFVPSIVLANGGSLVEKAERTNTPFVLVPRALSPRSSLGYFLGFILVLLDRLHLLQGGEGMVNAFIDHAHLVLPKYSSDEHFRPFVSAAQDRAFFHIWGVSGDSAACAYRAQTQFNENAKIQTVSALIPELCHNLLVGFTQAPQSPLVLLMHTDFLSPHLFLALEAISEILAQKGVVLYKAPVLGDTFEQQLFDMVLWADFASCFLALAHGVDVIPVKIIDQLKEKHRQKGIK